MKLDIRFGECPSIYCDSDTWENRNSKIYTWLRTSRFFMFFNYVLSFQIICPSFNFITIEVTWTYSIVGHFFDCSQNFWFNLCSIQETGILKPVVLMGHVIFRFILVEKQWRVFRWSSWALTSNWMGWMPIQLDGQNLYVGVYYSTMLSLDFLAPWMVSIM